VTWADNIGCVECTTADAIESCRAVAGLECVCFVFGPMRVLDEARCHVVSCCILRDAMRAHVSVSLEVCPVSSVETETRVWTVAT